MAARRVDLRAAGRCPLSGIDERARQAFRLPRHFARAAGSSRARRMAHVRTAQEGSERKPAAAADRRAPALVRRGRPAGHRLLRLSRPRLPAALRHLPGLHRALGLAQRLPAHPLSRAHPPRHRARHLSAGLRHPPALGAALPDGRHREPLHVPAGRAGDGVGRHAAAAQHHRARAARRGRHGAAGVLPPAAAVVPRSRLRSADALQRRPAGLGAVGHDLPGALRLAARQGGAADGGRARRHRDGAGARAAAARARRSGRRRGARARHAALDHRRGRQGADAGGAAGQPVRRGPGAAADAGRALPRDPEEADARADRARSRCTRA